MSNLLDNALGLKVLSVDGETVTTRKTWNFLGDGISIADDPALGRTNLTVLTGALSVLCTDLISLIGTANNQRILASGYYSVGDGGGGEFVWSQTESDPADNGIIFGSGDSGRWIRVFSGPVNVRWFGAKGNGSTDDTNAIVAALAASRDVYIPDGTYLCGALTISRRTRLTGNGRMSIIRSTVTGSSDALTISPPAGGTENTGYYLADFQIENSTPGAGRHGIRVYLDTLAFFSNSTIERVTIGSFGNYGLWLDNTIANTDGFFTCSIKRNYITNGLKGTKVGDSITIAENTITGDNIGVYVSGTATARQLCLTENNITTRGGALHITGCEQPQVTKNQMEQPANLNYNGSNNAFVYLHDCVAPTILDNTISSWVPSSTPATDTIAIEGTTTYSKIDGNIITKGVTNHVRIANTTVSNMVGERNVYFTAGTPASPVIADSGVDTRGVTRPAASITLANSWVAYDAVNHPIQVIKHSDGYVLCSGAITGGTISVNTLLATLPSGCRPPDSRVYVVPNKNGGTWGTATILLDGDGKVYSLGIAANTELHLSFSFRVGY